MLTHLLRTSTAQAVRFRVAGLDFGPLVRAIEAGASVTTGDQVPARDVLAGLPDIADSDLYDQIAERFGARDEGERAAAMELALEGLYLAKQIAKDSDGRDTVYG